MSRHRHIRNMNVDDYADDGDDYDDYDEDDYANNSEEVNAEAPVQIAYTAPSIATKQTWKQPVTQSTAPAPSLTAIRNVAAIVGSHFSIQDVRKALISSNGSEDRAVNMLLDGETDEEHNGPISENTELSPGDKATALAAASDGAAVAVKPYTRNDRLTSMPTPALQQPRPHPAISKAAAPPSLSAAVRPGLLAASSGGSGMRLSALSPSQGLGPAKREGSVISDALAAMSLRAGAAGSAGGGALGSGRGARPLLVPKKAPDAGSGSGMMAAAVPSLSRLSEGKLGSLTALAKGAHGGSATIRATTPLPLAGVDDRPERKLVKTRDEDRRMEVVENPVDMIAADPSSFAQFWTFLSLPRNSPKVFANADLFSNDIFAARGSNATQGAFDFLTPSPDDRVLAARAAGKKGIVKAGGGTNQKTQDPPGLIQGVKSISITSPPREIAASKKPALSENQKPAITQPLRTASSSSGTEAVHGALKGKRIDIAEEMAKRDSAKSSINLVVVGHVDAGKSTLMGHLLFLLGEVNERTMKKFERDSEKMKKGSFCFAWVLDETDEERSRGVTIDVGMSYFETTRHRFTLLDAPGHRDFVPNMISGASQADVALLVIDSNVGEFEVGFDLGGQTREHALLVRSLGVNQLIVAVNKLDTVEWAESRFREIEEKLLVFLLGAGFKKDRIRFVPCSGFSGENMLECKNEKLKSWYQGPTLQECLDNLQPPKRPLDKPLRLPVVDYFKGGTAASAGGNLSVSGRIEAGSLQVGDTVSVMPLGEHATIKSIEINNNPVKWAAAGDSVTVTLNGLDVQQINVGNVCCFPHSLVPVADEFRLTIVTFDIAIPLTIGAPIVVHHQSASTSGIISKLVAILDKTSGDVVKKNPRAIPKNTTATIEIRVERPICVELAKESRELGRLMIRAGPAVVAAAIFPSAGRLILTVSSSREAFAKSLFLLVTEVKRCRDEFQIEKSSSVQPLLPLNWKSIPGANPKVSARFIINPEDPGNIYLRENLHKSPLLRRSCNYISLSKTQIKSKIAIKVNQDLVKTLEENPIKQAKMMATAPPTYQETTANADARLARLRELVQRHEISNLMALKLRRLESYNIVVIADDSGSMRCKSTAGLTAADPFARTRTRWDELKETLAIVTEVATVLDEDGIDIFFLNRKPLRNITGPCLELEQAFAMPPEGYTPITRVLRAVLREKWHSVDRGERKKLLILIATDGQPTTETGSIDKDGLKNVLVNERGRPGDVPVTFLVCTDDDDEIQYLNEWDNVIRDLDVVDDFYTERRQIRDVQGHGFPFSRGDWVCKMLLGSVDPEIDALDERRVDASLHNNDTLRRRSTKSNTAHDGGCTVQ
ncbi:HBS1-like protein [Entophlyctis sp. JEL0112]|nr:HBS1-like protein [Entophlyctis sp. JEL0112]